MQARIRGLTDLEKFGARTAEDIFPMQHEDQLARYIIFSVSVREPSLDASTVKNYVNGASACQRVLADKLKISLPQPARGVRVRRLLKIAMDEYKKPSKAKQSWSLREFRSMLKRGFNMQTRSGRHRRLCLWLHTLGVLRKSAGARLRVRFKLKHTSAGTHIQWSEKSDIRVESFNSQRIIVCKISKDKNVKAWKIRETVIPGEVKVLGLRPVEELEKYILSEQLPSGSYLLAAPVGRNAFRSTPYSNQSNAFKAAFQQVYPNAPVDRVNLFGSQSCRKSMASWLWDDDWDKRVIADHGGWALQRDAVDIYFKTGRAKMLWAIQNLGHVQRSRRKI